MHSCAANQKFCVLIAYEHAKNSNIYKRKKKLLNKHMLAKTDLQPNAQPSTYFICILFRNYNTLNILATLRSCLSIQVFYYTRCIAPKLETSLRGPSPRQCAQIIQLFSKKCRSGGQPSETLCPIRPAQNLNLRPPALKKNALPLDQLAGSSKYFYLSNHEFLGGTSRNTC